AQLVELAVGDWLSVPDQRRGVGLALHPVGEMIGERADRGLAHDEAPGVTGARSSARWRSNSCTQPAMLSARSSPVPIRRPLKPASTSSAAMRGSRIALAETGHGVPAWIVASSSERLVSMSPGSRSRVLMSLL